MRSTWITQPSIVVFLLALPLRSQQFFPVTEQATIQVSGTAQISTEPDQARLHMSVSEIKPTVVAAKKIVDQKVMQIQQMLLGLGVQREDLNTSVFRVNRVREPQRPQGAMPRKQPEDRYRVSREIRVTLRTIENLDTILDRSIALGTNEVWNVGLFTSRQDSLQMRAMELAAEEARRTAETLAGSLNADAGQLYMIEHQFGGGGPIRPMALEARGTGGEQFARGTITVEARVNAVFELKSGE
jgi:hypothetical protein